MGPILRWAAVAVALACAACGASHSAGATDGSAGDGGGPGSDAGTPLVADCPASPPTPGQPCDHPGRDCEYGADWSSQCNVLAQCWRGGALDHTWQVREPSTADCPTPTAPSAGCPADPPSGSCSASDPTGLCVYDTARCLCVALETGPPGGPTSYSWVCQHPAEPGCPAERPRIGSPCTSEGLSCNYAVCSFGGGTYCTDGAWTEAVLTNTCAGA